MINTVNEARLTGWQNELRVVYCRNKLGKNKTICVPYLRYLNSCPLLHLED